MNENFLKTNFEYSQKSQNGKFASDLVARLGAYRNFSQSKVEHANLKWIDFALIAGDVRDKKKADVLEPANVGTEAAITTSKQQKN